MAKLNQETQLPAQSGGVAQLHSFPKETQHFWSCVSFGEECIRVNDPRLHDPDPGPQEKSTEKSCVSFGKDCNWDTRALKLKFVSSMKQTFFALALPGGSGDTIGLWPWPVPSRYSSGWKRVWPFTTITQKQLIQRRCTLIPCIARIFICWIH